MKLDKQTMRKRGCLICTNRTSKKKYASGTRLEHSCKYSECPYLELNETEDYIRETKREVSEAESRANNIVIKMIKSQGE